MQSALEEFDFLHEDKLLVNCGTATAPVHNNFAAPSATATTTNSSINTNNHHNNQSSVVTQDEIPVTAASLMARELHRPLLSLPPIVLMGGNPYGFNMVTPSPIIEMPPSPAPNQMLIVEFPDDDDEDGGINGQLERPSQMEEAGDEDEDEFGCYFDEECIEVAQHSSAGVQPD